MEHVISQLERGTVVIKFFARKRPERKTLIVKRSTRQIIWSKSATSPVDGLIEISEIREIRIGKASKNFEKWSADANKLDDLRCFVIYYGSEFRLNSISVCAFSERECDMWVNGLRYLIRDTIEAPYHVHVQWWLRKEFDNMKNDDGMVSLKDIKAFLSRVNCKISTNKLRHIFEDVDVNGKNELEFSDFIILHRELMLQKDIGVDWSEFTEYFDSHNTITLQKFQKFLVNEQGDSLASNELHVFRYIGECLYDYQKDTQYYNLTLSEFIDFLFSKQNDIWDSKHDQVIQDMTRPLSHYWIASSHNTYLMGDQISSESNCQAYVRALRSGCRCIELDCWDGPDGTPLIFHGHTLTTKIRFLDVIKTIKEHAFATSDYPVILSIEDNCTVSQQRKMAEMMLEVFGEMLLIQPIDKHETCLPSPYALRKRIILKHKKLPEGLDETSLIALQTDDSNSVKNSKHTIKNGTLYLKDPIEDDWIPHFFILTEENLLYSDTFARLRGTDSEDDDEEVNQKIFDDTSLSDLHVGESWFHGKLKGGREEAEELLQRYSYLGDGIFLVRESCTFVGDYCLSFLCKGKINHCRIKLKQQMGTFKYHIIDKVHFDSLYSLISHYRCHPIRTQGFLITLQAPVPQPHEHEKKEWWHPECNRLCAENMLRNISSDGAFLVRPSEKNVNSYVISFRSGKSIKHCKIQFEGRLYTVGSRAFESLVELIDYYKRNPFYKRTKLSHPVYRDQSGNADTVTVKAIYDYKAKRDDELILVKHAIVTNVNRHDGGWWRGDYGGKKQCWFPANYVEIVEPIRNHDFLSNSAIHENAREKGSLDVVGMTAKLLTGEKNNLEWILRIENSIVGGALDAAASSKDVAVDWMNTINETAQNAIAKEHQNKENERVWKVAKEMSNLVVYCRTVVFNAERIKAKGFIFTEMSSFPENKAEKIMCHQENKLFLRFKSAESILKVSG
ncbi:1-phosphatidylinositol 4,5-bisphosphate phosphodiesterase gamma-1 isoform X2 [Orussus abietinus]|uniref:1-phosphatidylinositol 4,5-bisphosphate phosphodiesterase gamma-1 isoform X2 n=1 Tax=Orussus abietinus TaxID=222816 RepID=UPI000626888C|nr:1-phosphatidylinositol 4,5-bisphosphate phosphodiesterase gamma-1 isoform X2 [Orussus abietinus]